MTAHTTLGTTASTPNTTPGNLQANPMLISAAATPTARPAEVLLKRSSENKSNKTLHLTFEAIALLADKEIIQHKTDKKHEPNFNNKNINVIKKDNLVEQLAILNLDDNEDLKLIYVDGLNAIPVYIRKINGKIKCLVIGENTDHLVKALTDKFPEIELILSNQNKDISEKGAFALAIAYHFAEQGKDFFERTKLTNYTIEIDKLIRTIAKASHISDVKDSLTAVDNYFNNQNKIYIDKLDACVAKMQLKDAINIDPTKPLPPALTAICNRISTIKNKLAIKGDNYISRCELILDHYLKDTKLAGKASRMHNRIIENTEGKKNQNAKDSKSKDLPSLMSPMKSLLLKIPANYSKDKNLTKLYQLLSIGICIETHPEKDALTARQMGYIHNNTQNCIQNLLNLFETTEKAIQYINNHIKEDDQNPLYNLISFRSPIHDPDSFNGLLKLDKAQWSNLALLHGTKITRYFYLAQEIEARLRLLNITQFTLENITEAAKYVLYPDCEKDMKLADLCMELNATTEMFNESLKIVPKLKKFDFLPDVNQTFDMGKSKYTVRKLDKADRRGFFLGRYTGCCQFIGSIYGGRRCAGHGMTSPYTAFYIIEDEKNKIAMQCFIQIGKDGQFIIDSFEKSVDDDKAKKGCEAFLKIMQPILLKEGFTAIVMGQGGQTPDFTYKVLDQKAAIQPRGGYNDYSDAKTQYLIAEAPKEDVYIRFKKLAAYRGITLPVWMQKLDKVSDVIPALLTTPQLSRKLLLEFFVFLYKSGYCILHEWAKSKEYKKVFTLLLGFNDRAPAFILLRDNDGFNLLHHARMQRNPTVFAKMVELSLAHLSLDDLTELSNLGNSILHDLMLMKRFGTINKIIEHFNLTDSQVLELFKLRDKKNNTFLQLAVLTKDPTLLKYIFNKLKDKVARTAPPTLMNQPHRTYFTELLSLTDSMGRSAFNLIIKNHFPFISNFVNYFTDAEWISLTNKSGYNIFEMGFRHDAFNIVLEILGSFKDPYLRHGFILRNIASANLNPRQLGILVNALLKIYSNDPNGLNEVLLWEDDSNSNKCSLIKKIAHSDPKLFEMVLYKISKNAECFDEIVTNANIVHHLLARKVSKHSHANPVLATLYQACTSEQRKKLLVNVNPSDTSTLSGLLDGDSDQLLMYLDFVDKTFADEKEGGNLAKKDLLNSNRRILSSAVQQYYRLNKIVKPENVRILLRYLEKYFTPYELIEILWFPGADSHLSEVLKPWLNHPEIFYHLFAICKNDKKLNENLMAAMNEIMYDAVQYNNAPIIDFLFSQKPNMITPAIIKNCFQIPYIYYERKMETMDKLWGWIKQNMSPEEQQQLLLGKNIEGHTIIHTLIQSSETTYGEKQALNIAKKILTDYCDEKTQHALLNSRDSKNDNLVTFSRKINAATALWKIWPDKQKQLLDALVKEADQLEEDARKATKDAKVSGLMPPTLSSFPPPTLSSYMGAPPPTLSSFAPLANEGSPSTISPSAPNLGARYGLSTSPMRAMESNLKRSPSSQLPSLTPAAGVLFPATSASPDGKSPSNITPPNYLMASRERYHNSVTIDPFKALDIYNLLKPLYHLVHQKKWATPEPLLFGIKIPYEIIRLRAAFKKFPSISSVCNTAHSWNEAETMLREVKHILKDCGRFPELSLNEKTKAVRDEKAVVSIVSTFK